MMFFVVGISTLNAQTTTCTPAQMEACKKICKTAASCTPAQKAACKKVCNNNSSTKTVSTSSLTNPFVNVSSNPKDLTPSCGSSKMTKGEAKSCKSKTTKVVKNETTAKSPIAQKVAVKSEE